MDDVISITTDKGANMLRAIKIWILFQSHLLDDFLDIDLPFTAQQEAYDIFIDKELKKYSNEISSSEAGTYCTGLHCVAHSLNLAFDDRINNTQTGKITIDLARNIIKKLRTDNIQNLIHLKGLPKPILDVSTRWCSTHAMLESMLKLKTFVQELALANEDFATTDDFWGEITDTEQVLKFITITMKQFESENLILSDVYKYVTTLKLQLDQYPFLDLAVEILKVLEDRFAPILKSVPMLACMYLDPRFQCKNAVINDPDTEGASSSSIQPSSSHTIMDENENLLEKMLQSKCTQARNNQTKNIRRLLEEFDFESNRMPSGTNVAEFWQNSVATRPELFKLAAVILSIPPAEVTCERAFSTLNFVFNKLRNRLSDKSLQRIMFIKLNLELFEMK